MDQDIPNLILSLLNSQIERKDTNCAGHLLVALGPGTMWQIAQDIMCGGKLLQHHDQDTLSVIKFRQG